MNIILAVFAVIGLIAGLILSSAELAVCGFSLLSIAWAIGDDGSAVDPNRV